ncbi:hypothetical protein RB195_013255 [Necator americanus]|uniref:Uncharacterized protein n=1 Tax=Necator americanus TaxID=51031 RepID=A0ABR1DUN6_NECAM
MAGKRRKRLITPPGRHRHEAYNGNDYDVKCVVLAHETEMSARKLEAVWILKRSPSMNNRNIKSSVSSLVIYTQQYSFAGTLSDKCVQSAAPHPVEQHLFDSHSWEPRLLRLERVDDLSFEYRVIHALLFAKVKLQDTKHMTVGRNQLGGIDEKVMFFAFYVGNDVVSTFQQKLAVNSTSCSLTMNIDNTRSSISSMQQINQEYSFILFTDVSRTLGPFKSLDAISKLDSIRSNSSITGMSQTSVMKEYIKQSTGNNMDQLVFYIPCSYVYRGDSDQANFVQLMKDAGTSDRTLIVSLTNNATDVGKWYEQGDQNVIGIDTPNAVNKTVAFEKNAAGDEHKHRDPRNFFVRTKFSHDAHSLTVVSGSPSEAVESKSTIMTNVQLLAIIMQYCSTTVQYAGQTESIQSLLPLHSLQPQALLRQVELLHREQQPQSLPSLHSLQPQALLRQVELLHREQQPQSLPPLHSLQAQALLRQVELLRHQQQQPQSLPPLHSLQAQALLRQVELLGTATSVTSSTAQPTSTGLLRQVELLHF